jgi:hypothetical protein
MLSDLRQCGTNNSRLGYCEKCAVGELIRQLSEWLPDDGRQYNEWILVVLIENPF